MTETTFALAFIFALDVALIAALFSNYHSLKFPFLWYAGIALLFEFCRNVINSSFDLFENDTALFMLSGLCAIGRGTLLIHAAGALTNIRFRWPFYAAVIAMFALVTAVTPIFDLETTTSWFVGMTPVVLFHAVAGGLVLLRSPAYTQGRLALAGFLLAASASLVMLAVLAPQGGALMGLAYLADALFVILAGIMFVVVALESVQTNLSTAQRQTEESELRYRQVFESAFDGIVTIDGHGTITNLNPQAEAIFGWNPDNIVGRDFADTLLDASDRGAVRSAIVRLAGGEGPDGALFEEIIAERKSGESFPVELIVRLGHIGEVVSINIFARDLTAQKRAEEEQHRFDAQLQHTQKLESLGILAGGIAHDFNNFLAGILGFAGLAREALPAESPAHEDVREIETIAEQAADLTKQLLAYSGRGAFVQKPLQLSAIIKEMERLLLSTIDKKIEVTLDLERVLPLVKGDSSQISQIVLNLVSNASDSMQGRTGQITIRTGLDDADAATLAKAVANAFTRPGPAVFIEVTDTGCGMENSTRERMFDPFFTTKFTGRGLGMAAVIGIVRSHAGAVFVESKVNEGTAIRVLFPVHSGTERVAYLTPPEPEMANPHDGEWTGRGVALVVDDESSVRTLAKQVLEKRGFTVVTASDGSEGIELYKRNRSDLAIVLLDLTMPKVGGIEALRAMRNIRSDVPVILSSGYNESNALDQEDLASAAGFIQKPYRASALSDKVRDVLFAPAAVLDRIPETDAP